nr:PoNe immunity protein domain-containing protein [uncultured Tyzzerella sp.]
MRDRIKDKEYFERKYIFHLNCYSERFEIIKRRFKEEMDRHPYDIIEKAMRGYYYGIFLSGFDSFYIGYSLGMDIKELKPIGEGLLYGLYKRCKWKDNLRFEDIRVALIFIIILNIKTEYVEKFIKLIREKRLKDRYIDHLINYIDEKEEIKAKEILFKKREKTVMDVVDLAKEGKKEEATKLLKKYVEKQWLNMQDDQCILDKNAHLRDYYVGYWCIEAAALVKMYNLDDEILKECDYYPYELAHFEG